MKTLRNVLNQETVMYESPQVEMIEVEIEKGFAQSGGTEPLEDYLGAWM